MALSGDVILETHSLVKDFNGFIAVDGVSVRVRQGEIHALIGPNGAGKTTFFNLLTKFLQPTSGTIFFRGKNITREKPADIARRGVVRSFQICAVFPILRCSRMCESRCNEISVLHFISGAPKRA
jgi:branched-chain amino acid transport system ATP-binding protein